MDTTETVPQNETMPELRIRDVPISLRKRIGMASQQEGLSISAFVVQVLERHTPTYQKESTDAAA